MKKTLLCSAALLLLCGCAGNKAKEEASATNETADIRLDSIGLQGAWSLTEYTVGNATGAFTPESGYALTFDEEDNIFGISTDCNQINGGFSVTNDTIRFGNTLVTEMACDKMEVETNMLRLINDSTAYALCQGDTITLIAPQVGTAKFVKK